MSFQQKTQILFGYKIPKDSINQKNNKPINPMKIGEKIEGDGCPFEFITNDYLDYFFFGIPIISTNEWSYYDEIIYPKESDLVYLRESFIKYFKKFGFENSTPMKNYLIITSY